MKLLILVLALSVSNRAYANPPEIAKPIPPTISPVRRPVIVLPDKPRNHAEPADGLECRAPLPEEIPVDPATHSHLSVLLAEPATEGEEAEVTMQMRRCFRGETKDANPFLILALYRYEADLDVPPHARGIFGAILCGESAMRTTSRMGELLRGDWRDGFPGAHGPFSLHKWAETDPDKCRLTTRDDLLSSAACWWSRVLVRVESDFVKSLKCKDPWPLAESLVSNQGKYAGKGCRARSTHWAELDRWRGVK